jgi:hypothetical protein
MQVLSAPKGVGCLRPLGATVIVIATRPRGKSASCPADLPNRICAGPIVTAADVAGAKAPLAPDGWRKRLGGETDLFGGEQFDS